MDRASMLTQTNPPLPPFPWLVSSEPELSIPQAASRRTGHDSKTRQLRAGIAAAFAVLCSGTSFALLWPSAQMAPTADLVGTTQAAVAAVLPTPVETGVAQSEALIAAPPAIMREAAPPAVMTKPASQNPVPAPLIGSPPAVQPVVVPDAAPVVAPPPPTVAEAPASAATIAEFRTVIEDSRDAARLVIRLANRQRPPRDASAEELTRYRLRQQNAEAARGYRRYLDTLTRSMRGSPSQTVSQQSLERARQTQAYLTTMLADSQASLR
jgi:hypothetical protein